MRVAINLLGLPSLRQGGAALHAHGLMRGLAERSDIELTVVCDERLTNELDGLRADVRPLRRRSRSRLEASAELALAARDPRRFSDGYGRLGRSALGPCDLVHYPLSFMAPPEHSRPSVVTSVDVQHRVLPENFTRAERLLRRVRWDRGLAAADRVIAISRFTAATLQRFGLARGVPVDVVPLACEPSFFESAPAAPFEWPYVFYPASPLPAKNHDRLLRSFAAVVPSHPELRLVLCGPALHDWSGVRRRVAELALDGRVVIEGTVGLGDLRSRYADARGLIFPSLFEGFGLPLVEAMASGCPIAAGQAGSVPEVLGGAGTMFDPRDETAIGAAIARLAELSPAERETTVAAGRERAEDFRPAAMLEGTVAVYRKALAGALT